MIVARVASYGDGGRDNKRVAMVSANAWTDTSTATYLAGDVWRMLIVVVGRHCVDRKSVV